MKQFTVKDFLTYNAPCFGCGDKINFYVAIQPSDQRRLIYVPTKTLVVNKDSSSVNLITSYHGNLNLSIAHITNSFKTNDMTALINFFKSHKLYLRINCRSCHSLIETQYLDFNLIGGYIKPVGISKETITIIDDDSIYQIQSHTMEGTTNINVSKQNYKSLSSPVHLQVPLIPLSKFKSKKELIEKIKLYLIFS